MSQGHVHSSQILSLSTIQFYCDLLTVVFVIWIINTISNSQLTQQCRVVFSSYGFDPTFLCSMSSRWNYKLRPSVVHNLEIASLSLTKTYVVEEYSLFMIILVFVMVLCGDMATRNYLDMLQSLFSFHL